MNIIRKILSWFKGTDASASKPAAVKRYTPRALDAPHSLASKEWVQREIARALNPEGDAS